MGDVDDLIMGLFPSSSSALDVNGNIDAGSLSIAGVEVIDEDRNITANTLNALESNTLSDNTLVLNSDQTGVPDPALTSGIVIERGSQPNYALLFRESTDEFTAGPLLSQQVIATRQDSPVSSGIAYYNPASKRFDTASALTVSGSGTLNIADMKTAGDFSCLIKPNKNILITDTLPASLTGTNNICLRRPAGMSLTSGSSNILLGGGESITTGVHNILIGSQCMQYVDVGYSNISIGSGSGLYMTGNCLHNSLLGVNCIQTATAGSLNVAIGASAGFSIQGTANFNTILGAQANSTTTNLSNSIMIGFWAGYGITVANGDVVIGAGESLNNQLIWGSTATGARHWSPAVDGAIDLGVSGRKWRNVYAGAIKGLATPTDPGDVTTKAYVDAATTNLVATSVTVPGLANPGYSKFNIIMANGSGTLISDPGSLCWDYLNNCLGVNIATPTAQIHIRQSTTLDGTAPLKIEAGSLMLTPEAGALEATSSGLHFTPAIGARTPIVQHPGSRTANAIPTYSSTSHALNNNSDCFIVSNTLSLGTPTPASCAILHLESSTKGLMLPITDDPAGNVTSPLPGLLLYDETENKLAVYDDVGWKSVASESRGSWTPTIGDGTINFITSSATGNYKVVGGICHFSLRVVWTGKNSASGGEILRVSLPVAADESWGVPSYAIGKFSGIPFDKTLVSNSPIGLQAAVFYDIDGSVNAIVPVSSAASSGDVTISGSYEVA
jgi:hypothetical protein